MTNFNLLISLLKKCIWIFELQTELFSVAYSNNCSLKKDESQVR